MKPLASKNLASANTEEDPRTTLAVKYINERLAAEDAAKVLKAIEETIEENKQVIGSYQYVVYETAMHFIRIYNDFAQNIFMPKYKSDRGFQARVFNRATQTSGSIAPDKLQEIASQLRTKLPVELLPKL